MRKIPFCIIVYTLLCGFAFAQPPSPVSKGGTGRSTLTTGSLLIGNGTNPVTLLTTSTNSYILTMVSGSPAWAAFPGLVAANNLNELTNVVTARDNLALGTSYDVEFHGLKLNGLSVGIAHVGGGGTLGSSLVISQDVGTNALQFSNISQISGNRILGNNTGSASDILELTSAQVKSLLAISTSDVSGLGTAATHAASDFEVPLTFSTGLTRSTNTVTVNTTQNIAKLSNLTSNGFVKTSGSDGTLSIDGNTYLTGNQSITLSGDISGSGTTAITTTIGNNKVLTANILNSNVTLAKIADIADQTVLGNNTGGSAAPLALTASQGRTVLGLGTLATQNGTFSGTSSGTNTGDQTITLTSDVTGSGTGSFATTIANNAVTYAKMQAVSTTSKLLGSSSTTTPVQEITIGSGLTLTGTTLAATAGGGGTVTSVDASGSHGITVSGNPITTSGTLAFDLSSNGVALDRLATIADQTILGNNSGSTGSVLALTASQAKTVLSLNNVENTALSTWAGSTNVTTLGTISTGTWSGTTVAVNKGGTGQTSYTDGKLLIGNTSGNTLTKATLTGTSNQITVTNGNGSITLATPQNIGTGSSPTFAGLTLSSPLTLGNGGTGFSTYTKGDLIYSDATNSLAKLAVGTDGWVLTLASGVPTWAAGGGGLSGLTNKGAVYATGSSSITSTAGMTDGQLLIGSSSGNPALGTLTGTSNQITVTNAANSITLATPQNIHTSATPQFSRLGLGAAADATAALYGLQAIAANTVADGAILENSNAATSGNQMYSPSLHLKGYGWGTTASASQAQDWRIYVKPIQASVSTNQLWFRANNATSGYFDIMGIAMTGGSSPLSGLITASSGLLTSNSLSTNSILYAASSVTITGNSTALTYVQTTGFTCNTFPATTNTVLDNFILGNNSSSTPVASYGEAILFNLKSSTTSSQNASRFSTIWTDATNASRTSAITWQAVYNAGSLTEYMRLAGTSASASLLTLGKSGTTAGSLGFSGNTSGTVTMSPQAAAGTYTINLPAAQASTNQTWYYDGTNMIFGTLPVAGGGTGATTLTAHGVVVGNGTSAVAITSAGTAGQTFMSGGASADPSWVTPATSQATPTNPTAIGASTSAMLGLASSITPTKSGTIVIIISFDVELGTADNSTYQISYGTGSAPANGDALTGTVVGGVIKAQINASMTSSLPTSLNGIVTGLSVATAYWVDVQAVNTTGNPAAKNFSISIFEL